MIIIKSFKNLKKIKNRDEYIKICELNYANTLLEVLNINEEIERILPTEIINNTLDNKFTDIRALTKSGKIMIIEGQTEILKDPDLLRYYGYFKDTFCDYSQEIIFIIACLKKGNTKKRLVAEENICFKPTVVEFKNIDGSQYLNKLRLKIKQQEELTHRDCAILVHLPLFDLPISEKEYVREICGYIKEHDCIPQQEKNTIIPAMYLNIGYFIEREYEQEKLLEAINMLKYCENGLDREIRLAREDEAKKVAENFACNLLRDNQDVDYVHRMTGLPVFRIRELKANL